MNTPLPLIHRSSPALPVWFLLMSLTASCDSSTSDFAADAGVKHGPHSGPDAATEPPSEPHSEATDASPSSAETTPQDAGPSVAGDAGGVPVTIDFSARVGERPFVCGDDYESPSGDLLAAQDFRFFVSDLALVTQDGTRVPIQVDDAPPFQALGVALLDFEDGSGACANGTLETHVQVTGSAPAGAYDALSFSTAVPAALNHLDPATAPEPLAAGEMSWGWLLGYKFVRAELVSSELNAEGGSIGTVLHLGSTACAMEDNGGTAIECGKPNRNAIVLPGFELGRSVVVADLSTLLSNEARASSVCHSSEGGCAALFDALGIDFASGAAQDAQRLFHLE